MKLLKWNLKLSHSVQILKNEVSQTIIDKVRSMFVLSNYWLPIAPIASRRSASCTTANSGKISAFLSPPSSSLKPKTHAFAASKTNILISNCKQDETMTNIRAFQRIKFETYPFYLWSPEFLTYWFPPGPLLLKTSQQAFLEMDLYMHTIKPEPIINQSRGST